MPNMCGRHLKKYLEVENKHILVTPKDLGTRPRYHWGSDHFPVIIELRINTPTVTTKRKKWKFIDNKWQNWNEDVSNYILKYDLTSVLMGIDNIHNKMLERLNGTNRNTFLIILNKMFASGYVPKDWKCAIVAPILKPSKPPDIPESYRPISLTSCVGKIMEKL